MEPSNPTDNGRPARARRRRRSRAASILVLLVVGVGCVAIVYGALRDRFYGGVGAPTYSVYSGDADGYGQAAAFLDQLGWQTVALTRPIQQLDSREYSGLLILAEEQISPLTTFAPAKVLSQADVDGLLAWVKKGNTLLYCGPQNTRLHSQLGIVSTDDRDPGDTIYQAKPGSVGQYTAGIRLIGLEKRATVTASKAVPLWRLGDRAAAVAVQYGKGRVLIVPDASVLTHRGLLREDNAVFLYNVAALDSQKGRVYFDEYHHGIRSGGGYWNYLRSHNQHWILVQLLAIAVMALWMVGRRLGPAVPMPVTRRADGVDYASSVARIYEKADVRPLVAEVYVRHFHEALTQHLRLRRSATQAEIVATWRQRYSDIGTRELNQLLDASQSILRENASASQLVALAQRFDDFLNKHVRRIKPEL